MPGGHAKLHQKTPAEFFAEHQNIAGFDNAGKALFTTIREFVENSLDAAEEIGVLPDISLTVEKLGTSQFNELRGIDATKRKDLSLYEDKSPKKKRKKKKKSDVKSETSDNLVKDETLNFDMPIVNSSLDPKKENIKEEKKTKGKKKRKGRDSNVYFYRITCKDNGKGMAHDDIPKMLGIVLSSTKYGVKQTRGKFGLGAKMALVWSKKSTGLPIEVWTSQGADKVLSYCKLDIDIQKNYPRIIFHERHENIEKKRGTEITVVIAGKWQAYQSRVVQYMRQLAIITPYANIKLDYTDGVTGKKLGRTYTRSTDKMPPPPEVIKHHPSSVDNLLVEQLIHTTKTRTLKNYLSTEFSNIPKKLACRLIEELGGELEESTPIKSLGKDQIHLITTLLKEAKFAKPSGNCLSPAGQYNLRLGVLKEIEPDFVCTSAIPASAYEGHPFIVEAAVAMGGKEAKPGVTVYRFANRIPLLFEAGSDVSNRVANKNIKWSSYRVKNTDKITVFTSIVSTKVPFKGTSKEYIGDDQDIMHKTIKTAIEKCCVQLKKRIIQANKEKGMKDRKKDLLKYVPDVARAVFGVFKMMAKLDNKKTGSVMLGPYAKFPAPIMAVTSEVKNLADKYVNDVKSKKMTEQTLVDKLAIYIDRFDSELALEYVAKQGRKSNVTDPLYIVPFSVPNSNDALNQDENIVKEEQGDDQTSENTVKEEQNDDKPIVSVNQNSGTIPLQLPTSETIPTFYHPYFRMQMCF